METGPKTHNEENISQKYQHDHNLRHGFPEASALSSSVSTAVEALNHKLDYSLMSSSDTMDSRERERERGGGDWIDDIVIRMCARLVKCLYSRRRTHAVHIV